ncbi:MAG: hypothetical protein JWQ21_2953 [Herminiimonas sp.]|nr:hypothetical protein [Herminiimonas sp.]
MTSPSRVQFPLIVAAVGLVVALALMAVMLLNAQMLVRLGILGNVWFMLLLLLGVTSAVCLFALFKSYARYRGMAFDGTVELGGPAVLMVLVIVLGFWLVPKPLAQFGLTVFLHGEGGRNVVVLRNRGTLSLDLGADRRREAIGDKGEVRFDGIPANQRGLSVSVILDAEGYELADPNATVTLDTEASYLAVRAKTLHLSGEVLDSLGNPLAGAHLSLKDRTAVTDAHGLFDFSVPSDLAEQDSTLTITANRYMPWRGLVTPGGNPLVVRLEAGG